MKTKAPNTLIELLDSMPQRYGERPVVCAKEKGVWRPYSAAEFRLKADRLGQALIGVGLEPGDRIANMSYNRPEWNFIDYACMQVQALHIPLYPTLADQDLLFILNDAEVKILFVAEEKIAAKIEKLRSELPHLQHIYSCEPVAGLTTVKDLIKKGEDGFKSVELKNRRAAVKPDDVFTIIYTSGTMGTPKGVMLSHGNLCSNVSALMEYVPETVERCLSFLPLSHVFERCSNYFCSSLGITVYYAQSLETISADLQEVKPQFFTTVPRLLEKIYDKIVVKGSGLPFIKKNIFHWALALGLKYELQGSNPIYQMQLALANKLVFNKWREALGNEVAVIVVGGAALQPRLAKVFWSAGIKVLEGYGMTETSPVMAANHFDPKRCRFGTVGKALKNVELRIASDGEIICKGGSVFKGYYKRDDLTRLAIDEKGWFHTEDIGEFSADGFLTITDRKKELFKTSGGKYVSPAAVENKFKESLLIEQIMVLGENQRFPSALIIPNFDNLREWCSRHEIPYTNDEQMVENEEVLAKFQREADKYNEDFGQWERVKKFILLTKEWTIDGGELTPKLSMKRKVLLSNNADAIDEMYDV